MFIIAGPCIIESKEVTSEVADRLLEITSKLNIELVFKASYKKANRSSISSFTGIGDEKALQILKDAKKEFNISKVITDVHEISEIEAASEVADILQIPAFLCRQTDLIIAAATKTNCINIKKGQWMSAESMQFATEKALSANKNNGFKVWLTERGTFFGYKDLVVDIFSIPIMKRFSDKVIVDCTHSVQKPNSGKTTGGNPEMIETLALSAIAAGADGLFFEVHPNPEKSPSDAASILNINKLEAILVKCLKVKNALNS